MNKEQWEDGVKAWEKVKEQATIDLEQADLYIKSIQKVISELTEEVK